MDELFEKYLSGDMTPEEAGSFENDLAKDSGLRADYEAFQEERRMVTWTIQRKKFRNRLSEISRGKFVVLQPKVISMRRIVAVAASIAIILSVSAVSVYHFISTAGKKENKGLTLLSRREKPNVKQDSSSGRVEESEPSAESAEPISLATAFMVSVDGYLITSHHAVAGKKFVYLEQKKDSLTRFVAEVVDQNQRLDIAILKVNDPQFVPPSVLPFSFVNKSVRMGERVFTLGYPKNDIVYNEGPVSSLTGYREDSLCLQLALPVNPGYSGAPVFSENGEILGVITGKNMEADGESFGIKINYILDYLSEKGIELKGIRKNQKRSAIPDKVNEFRDFIYIVSAS